MNAKFLSFRHNHSVDDISGTTSLILKEKRPELFAKDIFSEIWYSKVYSANVCVVKPVVKIEGVSIGFQRSSRPNASDKPSWSLVISRQVLSRFE
jgi:hypothetical protein